MFGANTGVIQARADAVRFDNLAVFVLHHKTFCALQHADAGNVGIGKAGGVTAVLHPFPARFHAN